MQTRFVSEPIEPVEGTLDTSAMARGEPGLPRKFVWRGEEYAVAEVLRQWKQSSPCRHGSGERYVRKHWFEIRTTNGAEMRIYFERQPRSKRRQKMRWWLHTLSTDGSTT